MLNSRASLGALEQGRRVHAQIVANGCEANVFVGSRLVDMYARCGCMEDACRVFTHIPSRGVVTWNAMIFGHVKSGQGTELFQQMQQEEGVQPDPVSFVGVLNACASVVALK